MPLERKLVVEFIGTFFLVFTVGMAIVNAGDLLSWGDIWIYLLANFGGGAAAAAVFLYTQPAEKVSGDTRAAEPGEDVPERDRS
jgi:glycerol uptake facilitator-like aquaporin